MSFKRDLLLAIHQEYYRTGIALGQNFISASEDATRMTTPYKRKTIQDLRLKLVELRGGK